MNVIAVLFWLMAMVHFTPALAAIFPSQISKLYGIAPTDMVSISLLQHRAILLGLVGAAFASAALYEPIRWFVLIGGVISMIAFILICALNGQLSGALSKIVYVDAAALGLAVLAAFLMLKS